MPHSRCLFLSVINSDCSISDKRKRMSKRSIRSFFNSIQVVPAHEKGSDPDAPDPGEGTSGEAWGERGGDSSQQPPVKMAKRYGKFDPLSKRLLTFKKYNTDGGWRKFDKKIKMPWTEVLQSWEQISTGRKIEIRHFSPYGMVNYTLWNTGGGYYKKPENCELSNETWGNAS